MKLGDAWYEPVGSGPGGFGDEGEGVLRHEGGDGLSSSR
jgi:hypothetical protein